jgi:glycosyltransferase involved in cell wall biosynthesis
MKLTICRHPIVSVVMVVLNPHPGFFREAVESILAQTMKEWELIIVEDPCSFTARDMVKDYSDPRIRYFLNSHRTSQAEQRNRALHEAQADLVAVLDADDISLPVRLATQVSYLHRHPHVGVVGSQIALINATSDIIGHRAYPLDHKAITQALPRMVPFSHSSVMLRKKLALAEGGYDNNIGPAEDYDLWSRLARKGAVFANLPEVLTRYRIHADQMMARALRAAIKANLLVKNLHWRDQMDVKSRLIMCGQRLLLYLPQSLVRMAVVHGIYKVRRSNGLIPFFC